MPYKIIIWCHDCTGIDDQGCFGGGVDTIYVDPDNGDPIPDADRAAEIAFQKTIHCAPWDYEIELLTDEPDWGALKAEWRQMMDWAKSALAEWKAKN